MAELKNVSLRESSPEQRMSSPAWVSQGGSDEDPSIPSYQCSSACSRALIYSQEFCQRTSLHGLQYLGERKRPIPERACWLLVILISIACCLMVILKQWDKWQRSPVIITFAETSTPAWNIPFPAVTFCSEMQFKQSVLNYTSLVYKYKQENITMEEMKNLSYTHMLCDMKFYQEVDINGTVDEGIFTHFHRIQLPPHEMLQKCTWRSAEESCADILSMTITDEGICYSFNNIATDELFADDVVQTSLRSGSRSTKNWSPEGSYSVKKDLEETYPFRTMSAGISAGFNALVFTQDLNGDHYCRIPMEGFKMVVHNPAVFPEVKNQFFRVPSNRDVVIGVHPKILKTMEELHDYSPKVRQCFFQKERKLRFFKIYAQENCEFECFTNYTLKNCGCSQFFMPRTPGTRICGPTDARCIINIDEDFNFDADNQESCNCLPDCTEIKYDIEVSQSGYRLEEVTKGTMFEKNRFSFGSFSVFLKDMQVITRKRSLLYGPSDFLANCGGLLGLFLGFSILSLFEIFYFMSLRLFYNIKHHGEHSSKVKSNE